MENKQRPSRETQKEPKAVWTFLHSYTLEVTPCSMWTLLEATSYCGWYIHPLQVQEYTTGVSKTNNVYSPWRQYNNHLQSKFFFYKNETRLLNNSRAPSVCHQLTFCSHLARGNRGQTLRRIPLLFFHLMCNSVLGVFKIHIFIMREREKKKAAFIPKDMCFTGNLHDSDNKCSKRL